MQQSPHPSSRPGSQASVSPPTGLVQAISQEKEDAIRRLIEVTHTLQHARQMSQVAAKFVGDNMKFAHAEQVERARQVLAQEADDVFGANLPTIAAAMFPVYDRYFSLDEIEAMIEFNASELGQKLLNVMPMVMKDVALFTEDWARSLMPIFYKRALKRLQDEGIET